MGRLTTHILDTTAGRPADGVKIVLFEISSTGERSPLTQTVSNADGRTDKPLLADSSFKTGVYEIEFTIGDYFRRKGTIGDGPSFLDVVPLRFAVTEAEAHYHVPLLVSPHAYSTYRGS